MRFYKLLCKVVKNPEYIPSYLRKLVREFKLFDFDYTFFSGYSFSPKSICLIVTEQCNLKCIMCDIGQSKVQSSSSVHFPIAESIKKGREAMTLKDWKALVDDVVSMRWNPLILLTGTEPFLYPDLLELVEYIAAKNLRLHITTNGVLLSCFARQLVDFCKKPDSITITVSIDGIGEVHDKIRGVNGAFDKAIAGLTEVAKRKKEMGKGYPDVGITYTISNINYRHMRDFVQWFHCRDLGIASITFSHLWFKDDTIVRNHNQKYADLFPVKQENLTGLNLSEIDMDFIHHELRAIRKNYVHSSFSVFEHPGLNSEEAEKYYAKTTDIVFYNRCVAPWRNVSVTPKGKVIISPMCFDYPLGNVKEDSFSHIWNDVQMRNFRKGLKKVDLYPACVRCCMLFDSKPKYYKLKNIFK